jgi:hypothetical protein
MISGRDLGYEVISSGTVEISDLWLFVSPAAGLVLWMWALWDWGSRRDLQGGAKAAWLVALLAGLYLGATFYLGSRILSKSHGGERIKPQMLGE